MKNIPLTTTKPSGVVNTMTGIATGFEPEFSKNYIRHGFPDLSKPTPAVGFVPYDPELKFRLFKFKIEGRETSDGHVQVFENGYQIDILSSKEEFEMKYFTEAL
jgi:hypothetical protein